MSNTTEYGENAIHIQHSSVQTAVGGSHNTVIIQQAAAPRTPTFPLSNLVGGNAHFVGRTAALQALTAATEPTAPATPLVIAGLGGVGKSQLLRQFAHQHRQRFDIVWWARVDETWGQDMLALGRALCLPVDGLPLEAALQMVRTWLNGCPQRWLLLCDNADVTTPAQLLPLLPSHPHGRILITSRNGDWGNVARPFPLGAFAAAESDAFWRQRLGDKYEEGEEWEELASLLGHLPLALEHSAAYMLAKGKRSADYLRLYQKQRRALWDKTPPPPDYPATVATTWRVSFDAARETAGSAELLALCAFLAPVDLPLELLEDANAEQMPEGLRPIIADELMRDDALAALARYSLLQMGEEGQWGMHQLVQTVYRDQMGEAEAREWIVAVGQWLIKLYEFDYYEMETWPAAVRLLPHLQAAVALAEQWGVEHEEIRGLINMVGLYLQYDGQLQEARVYYERHLALTEKMWGAEHLAMATSLHNMGNLLENMGELAEARPYTERALAIYEKEFGAEHLDLAPTLHSMGGVLESMGELAEARPYVERALAIHEKELGPDHPATATSLNNMAVLLNNMGELAEARPYYERALAIYERELGAEHPSTAATLSGLSILLQEMGELAEARPYAERSLAIREKVLGAEHPETANSLNNLAVVLAYLEEYPEAIRLMRRAVAIREEKLGFDHPQTEASRENLAAMEAELGEL